MKTLLVTAPMPEGYFSRAIHALDADAELLEYHGELGETALADVDSVLAWQLPAGLVRRLPGLRWICAVSAGVDKLLVPELAPQVMVSRIVDAEQAHGIAQFVVLMALRHARQLPVYEAQQQRHEWKRQPVAAVRSRVAVLGMGAMGSVVAQLLAQVGFEVHGWSRRSGQPLSEALGEAEMVVCALPLTPETDRLLDARAFAAMRRGAYLINIARGAHVVEPDLIAAVRSGQLAGAALDVQRNEPMAADDALWEVPGITITPHIAAQSSPQTIATQFLAGLRRLRRGETPPNVVDRQRGY
ncbi:NAD(P)-dependent oxidoreductase [Ideonella sp.]|uniref:NAD(P)-dependent oxidoreductase n=1 Tax=Ideonella sp. TaxID=1929293 RepID=UPI002B4631DA|nr:NAD(P)-dependent oxidoreductase [Ideonella sp.]HJV70459.1 NAD(P)-dependent oxidoreductase [Ideonella sp.]